MNVSLFVCWSQSTRSSDIYLYFLTQLVTTQHVTYTCHARPSPSCWSRITIGSPLATLRRYQSRTLCLHHTIHCYNYYRLYGLNTLKCKVLFNICHKTLIIKIVLGQSIIQLKRINDGVRKPIQRKPFSSTFLLNHNLRFYPSLTV